MDATTKREFRSRLEIASWGALLLWVGFCFIVEIRWGVGLLGVAVVILGSQAIRAITKLGIQGGWVIFGSLFAGAGLWHIVDVGVDFGPIVLVAAGVAVLLTAVFGNKHRPGG